MKIVIEGAGEVGSHLAKMLSNEGGDITVIDNDSERLNKLLAIADVVTVLGNPSSIKVMREAGVQHADLFIAVNPFVPQDVNIVSALIAKKMGSKKVTARIDDEEFLNSENKLLFKEMGMDLMFYPEKIAADEIDGLLKHPSSTESMDFARGKLQISVFKLDEESPILDMQLSDFASNASTNDLQFRVIAISRNNETIIPKFDTKFKYHDLVFIITTREGLPLLMKYFGRNDIDVNNVMVLGAGPIGGMVAKQLSKQNVNVKVIEKDKELCLQLSEKTDDAVTVVNGDGRNTDFLLEEGIKDYDAFVALTNSDEANVLACVVAKKFGVARTIAEIENIEYIHLAEDMGVDAVINKKLITAGRIFKFTLSDKVRFVRYMSGTDAEVLEYTVAPGSKITKANLKETDFPKNAIIGGVIRGSESFIAVGDTQIEAYDRVAVFAAPDAVKEVDRFFK
jgi:trk system potassium uptake protein TrkA